MKRCLVYIICSLTCLLLSQVQSRMYTIEGAVYDNNHQPLQYVNVLVNELQQGVMTDQQGEFILPCSISDEDSLTILFSYVGFEDVVKTVATNRKSPRFSIVMKESTEMLEQYEMNVIRKQNDAIELLNVENLKTMPNASGGIETLISTQAGVSMNNELSSQYSVRGGNYDENSVYVNSIEIYRPLLIRSGEQEGLTFVNPDMVESVSFSSGGFGVEYGDKMSSVLNIKYKQPTQFEGSASVSLLGASAYVGHSTKKFSQMHGVRYKTSSYMLGSLQTEAEYDPRFLDYQTSLTGKFSDKLDISFLGNISRNDYRFQPVSRETSFGTMNDVKNFHIDFEGQEADLFMTYFGALSLNFNSSETTKFSLLSSAFHTSENIAYDISGAYWLSNSAEENNTTSTDYAAGRGNYHEHARNDLQATVANIALLGVHKLHQNQLSWGATCQHEKIDEVINEWELRDSAGYSMPLNEESMTLYDNLNSDQLMESNRLTCYFQNVYTKNGLRGKFTMTGGLRYAFWSFNKENLISPRLSFAWFPQKYPKWGLRLSTGIYYQSLFYKEVKKMVTDDYGNSTIELNHSVKSPRSYQLLMASDYYFNVKNRPFKFSAELYGKYIDRIIPYMVENTQITYMGENCADGYAYGADMKLFGEFVPGTDSWVSLSLMQTKENIYGDDQGYISRPTEQIYNISLFFQDYVPGYEKLKVNVKLIWAQGLPFGPQNSMEYKSAFRMNDYRRVDLGATYGLRKGVDKVMERKFFSWMRGFNLNLDFFNLFNIKNENSFYWVATASGSQFAVPNYLTSFRVNFKIQVDF